MTLTNTTKTLDPKRVAGARAWFEELFPDTDDGVIRLATLDRRRPEGEQWSEQPPVCKEVSDLTHAEMLDQVARASVAAADAGIDLFASPYRHHDARKKGGSTERRHVHADVDGPLNMMMVRAVGGFAVASGSVSEDGRPHGHVYCRLARSVSHAEHGALCRALGRQVGGRDWDSSKCGDSDVLRPAGTANWKTPEGRPVAWLVEPGDKAVTTWEPADLAQRLGLPWPITEDDAAAPGAATSSDGPDRTDGDSAFGRVLAAAREHGRKVVMKKPGEAEVSCPGPKHRNGDPGPSLRVTAKGGRVLLYCRSQQCDTTEVLERLGLTWRMLRDDYVPEAEGTGTSYVLDGDDLVIGGVDDVSVVGVPEPVDEDDPVPEPVVSHESIPSPAPPADGDEDPDAFWRRSKFLTAVLAAARARRVGPYALLGAVLTRACAHVAPGAVLPPTRGTPASLNLYAALVGESGAGKSAALALGREFLKVEGGFACEPVEGLPGSGEGLPGLYVALKTTGRGESRKSEAVRVATSALFTCDEIEGLKALGERAGSTLMPTLRTAWSCGALGNRNASADTTRYVEPGTYRFALACGVQPELAGTILDDKASGWAQRWIWMPTYDEGMREPGDLRVLDFVPWRWSVPKPQEMTLPDEAVRLILKAASDANREIGSKEPDLDGHALLTRAKVAALFALLGGSGRRISVDDWRTAGALMEKSDETRAEVNVARKAARERADHGKGLGAGTRAVAKAKRVDAHHIEQGAKAIRRRLLKARMAGDPWLPMGDARKCLRSDLRKYAADSVQSLLDACEIEREERANDNRQKRKTIYLRLKP